MASFAGIYDHTNLRRDHAVECYGKTVTVYLKGSTTKATLYTDRTKVSTVSNPITAGASSWAVYADPGSNGDLYVRSDGGSLTTIYQKRTGTWTGIV